MLQAPIHLLWFRDQIFYTNAPLLGLFSASLFQTLQSMILRAIFGVLRLAE